MQELLEARPAPVPLRRTLKTDDEAALHRNLHCAHYGGCLEVALARAWRSWSCRACILVEPRPGPELDLAFHAQRRLW